MRVPKEAGMIPIGLFLLLVWLGYYLDPYAQIVYNPPFLPTILNIMFVTGTGFIVAALSSRSYLRYGNINILLLGCAVLTAGLASLVGGYSANFVSGNYGVTTHNVDIFLSSVLQFLSAIVTIAAINPIKATRRQGMLIAAYASIFLFVALSTALTYANEIPAFLTATGPTPIRQTTLALATAFFVLSSLIFYGQYLRSRSRVLFWYSLGLAMFAIGMVSLIFQVKNGDFSSWIGRFAQYAGGVYFLIAISSLRERVDRETDLIEGWAETFRNDRRQFVKFFATMLNGFMYGRIVTGKGDQPVDIVLLDANDAFERITGLRRDRAMGRKLTELLPEIGGPQGWVTNYGQVAWSGEPAQFESHLTALDKWLNVSAYSPKKGYFVAIFEDITERKRAENEALRARQKNELLADVAGKLLASDDPQLIIDDLATRTMRFLDCDVFFNYLADERGGINLNAYGGVTADEVEGMKHLDLGAAVCGCVAECGQRIVVGDILTSDDGRTPFLRSQAVQAYACHPLIVSGETIGTLSFGSKSRKSFTDEDLSVMKNVADQIALAMKRVIDNKVLKESEERFRSVLDGSLDAIYRFNIQTKRYEYVSPSFERVLDHTAEEMLAMSIEQAMTMIYPEDVPEVSEVLSRFLEYGEVEYDYRLRDKRGEYRWISNHISLVRDEKGRPLYRDGTIRNITEKKCAEKQLEEYARQLERSNEELQQFAYIASHDLQEPLRMVTTYVDLLDKRLGSELDAQTKQYMRFALDGSLRMKELIGDLLQYSRIDSQSLAIEKIDMDDKVRKIIEDLHLVIKERGAEIVAGPLPTVCADRTQVKQLLMNLISNAIKFNDSEPPRVEISATEHENEFVFAVRDNGIGIDEKYADKLFKMFSRLHTREEYPGTGIGLAISKKIVERHGGRIWFESEPGRGTTFYFTLPSLEASRMHSSPSEI